MAITQFGAFTPAAAAEIEAIAAAASLPPTTGRQWWVSPLGNDTSGDGTQDNPLATVSEAVANAAERDQVLIVPGEYDEDVTVATDFLSIFGCGPRNSIRITGVAAGTSTAMLLNGVSDVGLYNLNLEGRSGGSGLEMQGQIRRVEVVNGKIHGGTQALLLDSNTGGQIVDIRIVGNVIANAATGLFMDYNGGDPCHQIKVLGNLFEKITANVLIENGATHDWAIYGNYFAASDGTEPSGTYLDINETGTTGTVANNVFATTVFASAKLALASGVLFVNNFVQGENPGTAAYGTNGRPD